MSNLIRLAAGQVTAYELLTNDQYLVTNFPRQADMKASTCWTVTQFDEPLLQEFRSSLEVGAGRFYGSFATRLNFFYLTEDMRPYLMNTILGGNPMATVTAYVSHPYNGFGVYVGELITPYAANADTTFNRFDDSIFTENLFLFRRAKNAVLKLVGAQSGNALGSQSDAAIAKESQA